MIECGGLILGNRLKRSSWGAVGCTGRQMPIYRLLQNVPMEPEDISRLAAAYEQALQALGLADRDDPSAEIVAKNYSKLGKPACATRQT